MSELQNRFSLTRQASLVGWAQKRKFLFETFRAVLCASAIAAAAADASATTITYSGVITLSINDVYRVGDSWQLTVILPDPLTDTRNGATPLDFIYAPSSVTMAIGGVVRTPDFNYGSILEALAGSSSGYLGPRYGNGLTGDFLDLKTSSFVRVALGLGSYSVVTGPDGMLLPSVPMTDFDNNMMSFMDAISYPFYIGGVVTSYSVVSGYEVPDASPTIALFGLGLAAVAFLRRSPSKRQAS